MRPPLEFLFPPEIGSELIYSFVIIFCSLMVYYATKELYELSAYKSIKYFRRSFLFFAIAYMFKYFIQFILLIFDVEHIIDISPGLIFDASVFIFLYSISMAIFYLLHSVMWKKWANRKMNGWLFNILAILIALIGTLFRGIEISLILNLVLLSVASFILIRAYKDSKNKLKDKGLFIIYALLFVFCVLNVIDVLIPAFLQLFKLMIDLASISLFMIILYKVLRKTG